jgi:hypothetical protein
MVESTKHRLSFDSLLAVNGTQECGEGAARQSPRYGLGIRGVSSPAFTRKTTCWKHWWRTQSHSNPSPLPNSLPTGKRTGNLVAFALLTRFWMRTRKEIQKLAAKFPAQQNRELFWGNREIPSGWRATQNANPRRMGLSERTRPESGAWEGECMEGSSHELAHQKRRWAFRFA